MQGDIKAQTRRALENVRAILEKGGASLQSVVKTTVFLKDMSEFSGMNEVWDDWVPPGDTPPRATVQARLGKPEWKIEIVVTAALKV